MQGAQLQRAGRHGSSSCLELPRFSNANARFPRNVFIYRRGVVGTWDIMS